MKLVFSFLAEYALAHDDGRVYVIGGGITRLYAESFPYDHPQMSLVARIEFDGAESQGQSLRVTLVDAAGKETATPGQVSLGWEPGTFAPGEPRAIHIVLSFQQLHFAKAGDYSFHLYVGAQQKRKLGSLQFSVKKGQSAGQILKRRGA